jgi:AraC-like DNA-binding protein
MADAHAPLLPSYNASLIVGGQAVGGDALDGTLFSAMDVYERDLEVEVPPVPGHVLIVAPEPRASVRYRLDGRVRSTTFHTGFMALMPQGRPSWWNSDGCEGRMRHVHFAPDADWRLFQQDRPAALRPVAPSADPVTRRLVDLIFAAGSSGGMDRLLADTIAGALLCHLQNAYSGAAAARRPAALAGWQVRRSMDLLESRIGTAVSLEELAREVNLSPFHFARAFRDSTGLPPHRYLIQLRMRRACELLAQTSLSVGEVAAAVGYADTAHFSRLFRRTVGASPGAYRRDRRP